MLMKKLSFLALTAVGLLFGACASDKDVEESTKLNQYDMIDGQSAWISVGIALPGDPITRANEDLNDGVAAEFEVKSAMLVLFKGATEDDATLIKEYDIPSYTFNNEAGDNVPEGNSEGSTPDKYGEVTSTTTKIVQEIESPSLGAEDNLYGYVILNYKNNATGLDYGAGTKFSAFKEKVLKAIGIADESKGYGNIGTNGLVMTNVPIANKTGGSDDPTGAEVTTLAKIDKTAIYNTKAAAEAGSSVACIYVERAAVKVEVENKVAKIALEGATPLDFTFNGWALGNVNSSATGYYNTRQFNDEWLPYFNAQCTTDYLKYRMVGRTNFFTSGHTTAYRTYFGRDVNYTSYSGLIGGKLADADYALADKAATYTYENTFDENSQKYGNTTYAGFKVTIAGGDFYTIEGQPNTRLLEADLPGAVAKNAASTINTAITNINTAISADLALPSTDPNRKLPTSITKVTFEVEPVIVLGTRGADGSMAYNYTLQLKNVKDQSGADITGTNLVAIKGLAGTNLTDERTGTTKILKYVGGVTYYAARIAHFGDVETPWDAPAEAYNQYDKIYPTNGQSLHTSPVNYGTSRAAAWLGRWGIVRNNWYKITIDEIKGLGSPVPEDFSGNADGTPGGTPDDNPKPKYYIAAHVHILPWAVRKQSVKF